MAELLATVATKLPVLVVARTESNEAQMLDPDGPSRSIEMLVTAVATDTATPGGRVGTAPLLEAALAHLGYDAQTCADICASRLYPEELLAAATAAARGSLSSPAVVREALDSQAGAVLNVIRALIADQLAELALLDATVAAAPSPALAAAAILAKKERRKMRLQWCTPG